MNIELRQVLTQVLAFLLMLWILRRYAWGPLFAIIDARKKGIEAEFNAIEEQKKVAAKLNEHYKQKIREIDAEAKTKINEAIAQSRKIAEDTLQETKNQSKALLAKAKKEVEREIFQAKAQLKNDIVNMAVSISKKAIWDNIDEAQQKKLIATIVEQADIK